MKKMEFKVFEKSMPHLTEMCTYYVLLALQHAMSMHFHTDMLTMIHFSNTIDFICAYFVLLYCSWMGDSS